MGGNVQFNTHGHIYKAVYPSLFESELSCPWEGICSNFGLCRLYFLYREKNIARIIESYFRHYILIFAFVGYLHAGDDPLHLCST